MITSILQTGPQKEALPSLYLTELIGLSADKPTSVYNFSEKVALDRLRSSPVIKEGKISNNGNGSIYIDYVLRKPLAWLAEFDNCAVDEEGYVFPVSPFFKPKKLPELYLGLGPFALLPDDLSKPYVNWCYSIKSKPFLLALDILKKVNQFYPSCYESLKIDVSKAFADSYGKREIVLVFKKGENNFKEIYIRLSSKHYEKELEKYFLLKQHQSEDESADSGKQIEIIDLRLDNLGLIRHS